jgi:hypothetical protein
LLTAAIGAAAILLSPLVGVRRRSPAYFQSPLFRSYANLQPLGDKNQVTLGGALTPSWAPGLVDTACTTVTCI